MRGACSSSDRVPWWVADNGTWRSRRSTTMGQRGMANPFGHHPQRPPEGGIVHNKSTGIVFHTAVAGFVVQRRVNTWPRTHSIFSH